jgi:carboxypeptidase Taq
MEQRFANRPAGAADGCLQDMHWALGSFGYFPSYALGFAIAAQLWEALRSQLPEVDELIGRGEFAPVFPWLRDNMHGYGAKLPIKELVKQATGQALSANALLRYLQGKYLAESA